MESHDAGSEADICRSSVLRLLWRERKRQCRGYYEARKRERRGRTATDRAEEQRARDRERKRLLRGFYGGQQTQQRVARAASMVEETEVCGLVTRTSC